MIQALTLQDIAQQLQRDIVTVAGADNNPFIERVSTDTRKIEKGDLYVALKGDRFDGNAFVHVAVAQGAVAAIVSIEYSQQLEVTHLSIPVIVVSDTREALGVIARMNRRMLKSPLIAITGSAGKTTTKNMLAAILAEAGEVLYTQGNYNNEIGVPLTLLRLHDPHQSAVVEMGAARPGDIGYLCQFAEPNISVLTSVLPAHIEGFGTLEAVAETKGEIFKALPTNGIAVINADSEYAALWKAMAECQQLTFGLNGNADFTAKDIVADVSGSEFLLVTPVGDIRISLPIAGQHNIRNALAAAAAAIAAGAELNQIKQGLMHFVGESGRLTRHVRQDGLCVIDDSYNANPGSVKAAIDVLVQAENKKILALGHMAELGADAERLHVDVAIYAKHIGVDCLWLVGEYAEKMAEAFGAGATVFNDRIALSQYAQAQLVSGDTILIKGSRSAGMEAVVYALLPELAKEELH